MAINNMLITIGKLKTAIRMLLLLALAAIADIKLNAAENPIDVKSRVMKKSGLSFIGSEMKISNKTYPRNESNKHKQVL